MKTRYYLYAGYYELWISPKRLGAPLTPISWHKSLEAAEKAAERYDEYATVIYDAELANDLNTIDRCETPTDQIADMAKYIAA